MYIFKKKYINFFSCVVHFLSRRKKNENREIEEGISHGKRMRRVSASKWKDIT